MAGGRSARGGRAGLLLGGRVADDVLLFGGGVGLFVGLVDGLVVGAFVDDLGLGLFVGLGLGLGLFGALVVGLGLVGAVVGAGVGGLGLVVGGAGVGGLVVDAVHGGGADGVLVDGLVADRVEVVLEGVLGLVVDAHVLAELALELGDPGVEDERVGLEGRVEVVDHDAEHALLDHRPGLQLEDHLGRDQGDGLDHLLGEDAVEQTAEAAAVAQVADQQGRHVVLVLDESVEHAVVLLRRTAHLGNVDAGGSQEGGQHGRHTHFTAEATVDAVDALDGDVVRVDEVGILHAQIVPRTEDHEADDVASDGVDGLGAREGPQVADVGGVVVPDVEDLAEPHDQRAALVVGGAVGGEQDQAVAVVAEGVLAQAGRDTGATEVVQHGQGQGGAVTGGEDGGELEAVVLALLDQDVELDLGGAPVLGEDGDVGLVGGLVGGAGGGTYCGRHLGSPACCVAGGWLNCPGATVPEPEEDTE